MQEDLPLTQQGQCGAGVGEQRGCTAERSAAVLSVLSTGQTRQAQILKTILHLVCKTLTFSGLQETP